jgi:LacI family transcriptional regulator
MVRGQQSEESIYRRTVRSARVDGMILSSPLVDDTRPALLDSLKMPFIVHGRTSGGADYAYLDIDNRGAFEAATRLLADLGHRRIALLNGDSRFNFAADRELGFRDALQLRGISPDPELISGDAMLEGTGYVRALRLLDGVSPPTAFLCSSLAQAAGVRRACHDRGLRAGEDLALIAHDDRLQEMRAESFDPPLTTTQSPISDAGRRIVELLVGMLRDPKGQLPAEVWPVDLVVRNSTPAPRR